MGSDCVAALLDRAKKLLDSFGNDTPSSEEACAKLQDDLDKNMDNACLSISKGSWTNLTSAGKFPPSISFGPFVLTRSCKWQYSQEREHPSRYPVTRTPPLHAGQSSQRKTS